MPGPPRHRSGGRRGERRKPPEEATGQERRFLNSRLKSGVRLRIEQIDGTRDTVVVRAFNEDSIEVDTGEQEGLVLRKSQIRYIEDVD